MGLYTYGDITSIPNALTQLYSVFQAAYPLDANGQQVFFWFGAELGAWSAPTTIEINGVHPADQEPADVSQAFLREETFSIDCKITTFSGGATTQADFFASMNATWNVWIALSIAVANNPMLNGVVRYAEFGEMDYSPTTDAKGMCMGTLTWATRCSARVTSLS